MISLYNLKEVTSSTTLLVKKSLSSANIGS